MATVSEAQRKEVREETVKLQQSGYCINIVRPAAKVAPLAPGANRLRALAIAISRRSTALPDVPTLEGAAGLPGFKMSAWQGIVVPAAMHARALGKPRSRPD